MSIAKPVRCALFAGAALCALALPALASAQAGSVDASVTRPEEDGLEEITITAQKRETSLQKTPVSVSVLNSEDLANRHVQSLQDLMGGAIPSLSITPFFTRSSALVIGIRGLAPADANQPGRDATVGIYIDGVYLGRSQGLASALYDVARIEVLKGPQGTLFGRNSIGGAVSIVTARPTGEFGLRQSAGISNYGGYRVETHLDLPAFANISLKFDGILTKREGTVNNPMAGQLDFNAYDKRGVHAGALWQPTSNFDARLDFDISYDATTSYYVQLIDKNPAAAALAPLVQIQPGRASNVDIAVPNQPSIGKTHGLALNLDWKPGNIEIRSITAYRHLEQSQYDNGQGAHGAAFVPNGNFSRNSLASLRQHQWSEELQLLGSTPQLSYIAGLYYYHEYADDDAWSPNTMKWNADGTVATLLPTPVAATPFPDRASNARADSLAAFGQLNWTPDMLGGIVHLIGGARYTRDKRSGLTALALLALAGPALGRVTGLDADRTADGKLLVRWTASAGVDVYVADRPDRKLTAARLVSADDRDGHEALTVDAGERPYVLLRDRSDGSIAMVAERLVPLAQGSNFRDLGGYPAAGGKTVRWGLLFRSGASAMLTDADLARVRALELHDIVDLRSTEERVLAPSRIEGVATSAIGYSIAGAFTGKEVAKVGDAMYRDMPESMPPQLRLLFAVLKRGEGPVEYNCSAGQDRTGFATAMILSALGVPRAVILQDYDLSTRYRQPRFEMPRIEAAHHPGDPVAQFFAGRQDMPGTLTARPLHGPDGTPYLAAAFAAIEARWGSVDAYLVQAIGLSAADIAGLRLRYLE